MKITKKTIVLIIAAIAVIILIIAAVIFVPRIINRQSGEPVSFNSTVIKCNVGQSLSETDLKDVEDIVKNIVGDKFRTAEKVDGFAPMLDLLQHGYSEDDLENMNEEEYERIKQGIVGDRLIITCLILTEDERMDIYNEIAVHFSFNHLYGNALYNPEISNIIAAGNNIEE